MSNLLDTLLNLWVFVFVGLMVWLLFKETPGAPSEAFDPRRSREEG